ncbi:hypothetical protein B0T19DRAFT_400569 [Cercophora scortea]|uniref:Uncharacterized protein n=1 Tax=Cercophora scortea TaxID=314031 RepID=A0AAE0IMN5_9PEZI|nr:hypothetical protein B0T19DRAFT_400569 [Cercophora scortea]
MAVDREQLAPLFSQLPLCLGALSWAAGRDFPIADSQEGRQRMDPVEIWKAPSTDFRQGSWFCASEYQPPPANLEKEPSDIVGCFPASPSLVIRPSLLQVPPGALRPG